VIEINIENCPYCGGKELGWGYQSAQGAVMPRRSGFAGTKVEHLICTECGSIVHSRVAKPELFKTIVKEKKVRRKRKAEKAMENNVISIKKEEAK
jgi:rRNA maturation protein Nop10